MRIHSGEVSITEFTEGLEAIVRSWNKSFLSKYLLNINYAAGTVQTVLDCESTVINKLDAFTSLGRAYIVGGRDIQEVR